MRIYLIASKDIEAKWAPILRTSKHELVEHFLEPFDVLLADAGNLDSVLDGVGRKEFSFILFNQQGYAGPIQPDVLLSGVPSESLLLNLITLLMPINDEPSLDALEDLMIASAAAHEPVGVIRMQFSKPVTQEIQPPNELGAVSVAYGDRQQIVWLAHNVGRHELVPAGEIISKHCLVTNGLTPAIGMTSLLPTPQDDPRKLARQALASVNQAARLSILANSNKVSPSSVYFEANESSA